MKILIVGDKNFISGSIQDYFHEYGHEPYYLNYSEFDLINKKNEFDKIVLEILPEALIIVDYEFLYYHDINSKHETKHSIIQFIEILKYCSIYMIEQIILMRSQYDLRNNYENQEDSFFLELESKIINEIALEYNNKFSTYISVLEFPIIFGSRVDNKKIQADYFGSLVYQAINENKVKILNDLDSKFDLIYINDVISILDKAIKNKTNGIFRVSANNNCNQNEFIKTIALNTKIKKVDKIKNFDFSKHTYFNESIHLINKTIKWTPKYSLDSSIKDIISTIKANRSLDIINERYILNYSKKKEKLKRETNTKSIKPYILNVVMFILILIFKDKILYNDMFFLIDLNIFYILFLGLTYGRAQGLLASILSSVLIFYEFYIKWGLNNIKLFFDSALVSIIVYFLVYLVVGYFYSSKKNDIEEKDNEMNEILEQSSKVEDKLKRYEKFVLNIKEKLILKENNLIKLGSVLKDLEIDSVNYILHRVPSIINDLLGFKHVTSYSIDSKNKFLRAISTTNFKSKLFKKNINYTTNYKFEEVINKRDIFINKELDNQLPYIIMPLVGGEKEHLMGVIVIEFEEIFESSIKKVSELTSIMYIISTALNRIVIDGLHKNEILPITEFKKIVTNLNNQKNDLVVEGLLLKLIKNDKNQKINLDDVRKCLRSYDFISESDGIYIYCNVHAEDIKNSIQERLFLLAITYDLNFKEISKGEINDK